MNVIKKLVENVPDFHSFMTVDELNESSKKLADTYPDKVKLMEIGKSRDGDPILCLKIGDGDLKALLYAFPHPNEPVGSLMLDYLSWKLVEDDELRKTFNFTWYIVKVADPDGARLNEGWFKTPESFKAYVLNYYRPAGNQQVEWTFPIKYKTLNFQDPIPETKALMEIIESEKPDFIYSLHNAGFGGVYYYITEEALLLYPIYQKVVKDRDLPLSLGEPEMPYAVKLDDAVYLMPTVEQTYDYYEKYTDKDPAEMIKSGNSSYGFAKNFNPDVFELVCEVPYYYDEGIEDTNPTDKVRRELVLKNLKLAEESLRKLENYFERLRDKLVVKTRFQEALEYFIETGLSSLEAEKKWAETSEELERKATVAEEFDNIWCSRSYRLFMWGMFKRMLDANISKNNDEQLKEIRNETLDLINKEVELLEKNVKFNVIPIKKLVEIQLLSGLYTMLYVQKK